MQDIRNTLEEGLEFYREQERLISARLALLPKGQIKAKKIGRNVYYYLHYRKGKEFKSDYLGKDVPSELRAQLEERIQLGKELKRVRGGLKILKHGTRTETDLGEPIRSILKMLTKEKLWESGLEIIGTWCFLLYQKHLPMEKYPLRTEDLDILVPLPYKGKPFDISGYLKGLGFRQNFHPDGSMSFSGNLMKVEFLAPEKAHRKKTPKFIPEITVTPQTLRFIDILFAEPISLQVARGIKVRLPSPAAFSLHKLLIATGKGRSKKRDKDIRQAVYASKYVISDKNENGKLIRLWESFPMGWKKRVRSSLRLALDVVPLERSLIENLSNTLG